MSNKGLGDAFLKAASNPAVKRAVRQGVRSGTSGKGKKKWPKLIFSILAVLLIVVLIEVATGYFQGSNEGTTTSPVIEGDLAASEAVWTADSNGNYYSTGYGPERVEEAQNVLATLPFSDKRTEVKYHRESQFGVSWQYDFDNSGCRTRADIMQWQMADKVIEKCEVVEGVVPYDPYTGRANVFVPRAEISKKWDIEHIVALEDVWRSGASDWMVTDEIADGLAADPQERREQIANDPINLMLVDAGENRSKKGKTLDQWNVELNPGYRCEYAQRQVFIKDKYSLGVTDSERVAMEKTLAGCKM